jgi:hypothetical protein
MQQISNTILEKKNQQQLQNLSHQLEQFKNNIMKKFNELLSDQQQTSNTLLFHPNNNKNNNKTT